MGKERLGNFQKSSNKRFDEVIYNIIFLSILIPHFLLPIASWRHGPQVAIFKNMWTHYQVCFQSYVVCLQCPRHYSVYWWVQATLPLDTAYCINHLLCVVWMQRRRYLSFFNYLFRYPFLPNHVFVSMMMMYMWIQDGNSRSAAKSGRVILWIR